MTDCRGVISIQQIPMVTQDQEYTIQALSIVHNPRHPV